jgi:hypothetical protein
VSNEEAPEKHFDLCHAIAEELRRDPRAEPVEIAQRVVAAMPDESLRPTLEKLLPRRVTMESCAIESRRVASGQSLAA